MSSGMAHILRIMIIVICVLILLVLLYSVIGYCWWHKIYKNKLTLWSYAPHKPQPLAQTPDHVDFNERLCGCFENWRTCRVLLFCAPFKIVETAYTAGVIPRDDIISNLLFLICCPCFYSCFFHPCRRAGIRAALGSGHRNWTYADLALTLVCGFCAHNQEAREVDRAVDAESGLCSSLFPYGSSARVVGLPMKVEDLSRKTKKRRSTMAESIAEAMVERHRNQTKKNRRSTMSESIAEGMVEYRSGIEGSI